MFTLLAAGLAGDENPGGVMIKGVDVMLEHGALGILAMGFIMLLILFWRADKRAERYAAGLDKRDAHIEGLIAELTKAHVNEGKLIEVIQTNTQANTNVAAQLAIMAENQKEHSEINRMLERRLALWQCPYKDTARDIA